MTGSVTGTTGYHGCAVDGTFALSSVSAGTYEIKAGKLIDGVYVEGTLPIFVNAGSNPLYRNRAAGSAGALPRSPTQVAAHYRWRHLQGRHQSVPCVLQRGSSSGPSAGSPISTTRRAMAARSASRCAWWLIGCPSSVWELQCESFLRI